MRKKIAILQSSYLPWRGYFDLIQSVDEFIFLEDVQYTARDWRNRNYIKGPNGKIRLTIPVIKSSREQKINETQVQDQSWRKKHWKAIELCYGRAPFFKTYQEFFQSLLLDSKETHLSPINQTLIQEICKVLEIRTPLKSSEIYQAQSQKSDRILEICKKSEATHYLSGPKARDYLCENSFREAGIQLEYHDYSRYLEYPQLFGEFENQVSIVDLIFNIGPEAPHFIGSQL